ncbi:hypothetical protein [Massilia antarctica]|uniref:hypothetical protein n=1 Tax=Massilia antarctica TaxID=2765360 RepID=UPI0006BB9417|nr:hypothetical protein [Massilia sp. H27-R4]MCY0910788.1 hypothetical protein [Massilia sp. H27-R4]CUI08830.1 hypothetical protein BN2497_12437 [Janthinobacterium sp. CG23_2]CUU32616.1 hypothetical protein BN3177_12437 [Janthinobacterium sp. CG23_2]
MKRAGGVFLLLLLAVLAAQKTQEGLAPELLWMCHVTSAMLALGLIADLAPLIVTGFLCQAAIALPAYVLHVAASGHTSVASFLLHLSAPALGAMAWRGKRMPAAIPWAALAIYQLLIALSQVFTPESLNVNLAFRPWDPLVAFIPWGWPVRVLNLALMLAQLHAARWLWNRYLAKTAS